MITDGRGQCGPLGLVEAKARVVSKGGELAGLNALAHGQLPMAATALLLDALVVVAIVVPPAPPDGWHPGIALRPWLQEKLTARHGRQGSCVAV